MYTTEKNLNKLKHHRPTFFLDPKEQQELAKKLKKDSYQVYKPYIDSEKNIFYITEPPKVILYEIIAKIPLEHREILGTIFSLNITSELFGDIIIKDNHYYIYLLEQMAPYIKANLTKRTKELSKLNSPWSLPPKFPASQSRYSYFSTGLTSDSRYRSFLFFFFLLI